MGARRLVAEIEASGSNGMLLSAARLVETDLAKSPAASILDPRSVAAPRVPVDLTIPKSLRHQAELLDLC